MFIQNGCLEMDASAIKSLMSGTDTAIKKLMSGTWTPRSYPVELCKLGGRSGKSAKGYFCLHTLRILGLSKHGVALHLPTMIKKRRKKEKAIQSYGLFHYDQKPKLTVSCMPY